MQKIKLCYIVKQKPHRLVHRQSALPEKYSTDNDSAEAQNSLLDRKLI